MTATTVRANARTLPEATNRRAVLGAVLAAGAVGATAALPAYAAPGPAPLSAIDRRVLDLWNRRSRMLAALDRIPDQMDAAQAQMPKWAQPGPKSLFVTGKAEKPWLSFDGDVGWPEIADLDRQLAACAPGETLIVRPSPMDLCEQFAKEWPDSSRRDANSVRRKFTQALVALDERLALRDAEKERTGYARLVAKYDRGWTSVFEIENAIREHTQASILALAASLVIGLEDEDDEDEVLQAYRASLRVIRPQLIGAIAAAADRVLAQAEKEETA